MDLQVQLTVSGILIDVYRLWFGFRTISVSKEQTFINGKPFYCHGFGMHEDFEVSFFFIMIILLQVT